MRTVMIIISGLVSPICLMLSMCWNKCFSTFQHIFTLTTTLILWPCQSQALSATFSNPALETVTRDVDLGMHAKSSLTLCDPMDCSLPGSSVHGIFQERMLEWVTTPPSRGSSPPRDQTHFSCISCLAGGFFTANTPREALWILVIVVQSLKSCPALGDHMDCSMVASPIS